jgi:hypothetical protein
MQSRWKTIPREGEIAASAQLVWDVLNRWGDLLTWFHAVTVHAEAGIDAEHLKRRTLAGEGIYPLTGRILAATAKALPSRASRPTGVRAARQMFASYEDALSLSGIRELR